MTFPTDADYLIDAYKDNQLLIATWHRGIGSLQVEISAFQARMERGEVDYIIVHDRNDWRNSYRLYSNGVKVNL